MTQPHTHPGIAFAPGETNIATQRFSPSPILFWLRADMGVSSSRIVAKVPNTFLGLVPLGSEDFAMPLSNVAGVGVNAKYSPFRLIAGLVVLILGFVLIAKNPAGIILILLAVSMLAGSGKAVLSVQNNGGAFTKLGVSVFEINKLRAFREEVNSRVFADHAVLRHQETISLQQQQLVAQQLNNQFMQQNFSASTSSPGAVTPNVAPPPPSTAPEAPQTAGWHADPHGRYTHRYHDGEQWTAHVSNGGESTTDPV